MKKFKSMVAVVLVITMVAALAVGCGKKDSAKDGKDSKDVKKFTAFFAVPGTEIPDDNRVKNAIAKATGAQVDFTWLTGQTAAERVGVMVAGGEYPDFIDGSTGGAALLEAEALIAIDEYWDDYPNVKNYLSEADWNKVKKEDGHVYIIPQFGIIQGQDTATSQNGTAFWIQKEVLKWANYPKVKTLDEYFALVTSYVDANPEIEGAATIGWEICTDDWRYFCLENPPMFLAGYPNDGAAIVDPDTLQAINYNTIPEAKIYFQKLNQVYNDGYIDPETFTSSYDQYISKISTGRVVGMVDQHWNFQSGEDSLKTQGLMNRTYAPLGITLEADTVDQYNSPSTLDVSNGISITTSCKDIEGAMKFLNDILSPEVMTLRYWGEKDVDYSVDEKGLFYRNAEQRANRDNKDWVTQNLCTYDYFPHFSGMLADGINTVQPADQPDEYFATLTDTDKEILNGYGYKTFMDFLTPSVNSEWFPLWSYSNNWTNETDYGLAKVNMDQVKHEWLPKVVMASTADFEATWEKYMTLFAEIDIEAYENALTEEVARRIAVAQGK